MVDISVGCTNENTYGISCVHCGKCGRKFTMNGIDDSDVVSKREGLVFRSVDGVNSFKAVDNNFLVKYHG